MRFKTIQLILLFYLIPNASKINYYIYWCDWQFQILQCFQKIISYYRIYSRWPIWSNDIPLHYVGLLSFIGMKCSFYWISRHTSIFVFRWLVIGCQFALYNNSPYFHTSTVLRTSSACLSFSTIFFVSFFL